MRDLPVAWIYSVIDACELVRPYLIEHHLCGRVSFINYVKAKWRRAYYELLVKEQGGLFDRVCLQL
ncbi:hypothetical protein J2W42_006799 [Rhizobium tibeticum]|nr:hypothetical protein [Rhizobium tibeticum]